MLAFLASCFSFRLLKFYAAHLNFLAIKLTLILLVLISFFWVVISLIRSGFKKNRSGAN